MRWIAPWVALALSVGFAATAIAQQGAKPVADTKSVAPPTDWRRVVMHEVGEGEVGAQYRKVHALGLGWPETDEGRRGYAKAVPHYSPFTSSGPDTFRDRATDGRGEWTVIEPAPAKRELAYKDGHIVSPPPLPWPTQLVLVVPESTDADYRVALHAWCENAADCASLRGKVMQWAAPPPPMATPAVDRQWEAIALAEPCAEAPPKQAPIRYPPRVSGKVVVQVVVNPCGEVRRARLVESSGNRQLDSALIDVMRRSRLAQKRVIGVVPLEYILDPPPAAGGAD
jgi:TonB family protein